MVIFVNVDQSRFVNVDLPFKKEAKQVSKLHESSLQMLKIKRLDDSKVGIFGLRKPSYDRSKSKNAAPKSLTSRRSEMPASVSGEVFRQPFMNRPAAE